MQSVQNISNSASIIADLKERLQLNRLKKTKLTRNKLIKWAHDVDLISMFENFHGNDKQGEWLSCIKSLSKGEKKNLPIGMASLERLPLRHLRVFIDDFVSDIGIESDKLENLSGKRLHGFITRNRYRQMLGKTAENKSSVQVSIQNEVKIPKTEPSEEKFKLLEKKLKKLLEPPKPKEKKILKSKPKEPQTLKKKVAKLEKQLKTQQEFQDKVQQQLKEMNVLTSLASTKLDMQFLLARLAADKTTKPETPSTEEERMHAPPRRRPPARRP